VPLVAIAIRLSYWAVDENDQQEPHEVPWSFISVTLPRALQSKLEGDKNNAELLRGGGEDKGIFKESGR
jgi:hypothetical protein